MEQGRQKPSGQSSYMPEEGVDCEVSVNWHNGSARMHSKIDREQYRKIADILRVRPELTLDRTIDHPTPSKKIEELEHQVNLLAQALGKCIHAAGITRDDAHLSGPDLLLFADELEQWLQERSQEENAAPAPG